VSEVFPSDMEHLALKATVAHIPNNVSRRLMIDPKFASVKLSSYDVPPRRMQKFQFIVIGRKLERPMCKKRPCAETC
jgi:hypothetical protein